MSHVKHDSQSQDSPLCCPDSCGSDVMMVMQRIQDEDHRCFMTPGQLKEGDMCILEKREKNVRKMWPTKLARTC